MSRRSILSVHSFSTLCQLLGIASVALLCLPAVAEDPQTLVERENGQLRRRIASLEAELAACCSKCAVVPSPGADLVARQDTSRFASFTTSPRPLPTDRRRGAPSRLACHTVAQPHVCRQHRPHTGARMSSSPRPLCLLTVQQQVHAGSLTPVPHARTRLRATRWHAPPER